MLPYNVKKGQVAPIVLSIPHSGTCIPEEERASFLLEKSELDRFIQEAVDWYTDELYDVVEELGGASICHTINRIVVDTERFEDDEVETMAAKGLGALYVKTYEGATLRAAISYEKRQELLSLYFRSYHTALEELVTDAVDRFGHCLLLDCHSFGSIYAASPFYDSGSLPDLCLGTDKHHESQEVTQRVLDEAKRRKLTVSINYPYSGVVVPTRWYGDSRVLAYMLELNKSLYLKSGSTEKGVDFLKVKFHVRELVKAMLDEASNRIGAN